MLTINEFKEYTDELVKDYQEQYENPIEAIIMATFELCEHYNLYKTKIEYARTRNSYESFRKFFTPNSPLENKIDDFFQETAECYEKDLKDLLIMSFFYSATMKPSIAKGIKLSKIDELLSLNGYAQFKQKMKNFKKEDNVFLKDYFNMCKSGKAKAYNKLKLFTIYDIGFLTFASSSVIPRWNPFFSKNTDNSNNQNEDANSSIIFPDVQAFLAHSKYKNVFNNFSNKSDGYLKSMLKDSTISTFKLYDFYNIKTFLIGMMPVYTNFLLERFTHCNFINRLWQDDFWDKYGLYFPNISRFSLSPLLNYRMKVIDFHREKFTEILKAQDMENWNRFLKEVIYQQVFCTIPMMVLVCHYLLGNYLRTNEVCVNDIEKVFEKNISKDNYNFYIQKHPNIIVTKTNFPKSNKLEEYKKLQYREIQNTLNNYTQADLFNASILQNFYALHRYYSSYILTNRIFMQDFSQEDLPFPIIDDMKLKRLNLQ